MNYKLSGIMLLLVVLLMGCQSTTNQYTQAGASSSAGGSAPAQGSEPAANLPPESTMAFRVNNKIITVQDYQELLKDALGPAIDEFVQQGMSREEITSMAEAQNFRQIIFDRLIQEELMLYLARQEGVGVDPSMVDAEVERRKQMAQLQGEGELTDEELADIRIDVTRQQLILKMIAQNTTADMFKSRHILVEDDETAQEVLNALEAGESFADLAQEYSQDPGSAEQGGELGWVARGEFVSEFETVALSDTVALNTPVVAQSQFGYHIIEVQDREFDRPFGTIQQLQQSRNAGQHIDQTFVPWYESYRRQAEQNGVLVVNPDFDPQSVPLPIPDDVPEGGETPPSPPSPPSDGEAPSEE